MDAETLRKIAEMALGTAFHLDSEAYESYDSRTKDLKYTVARAFADFADRLWHAAEHSGE